MAVSPKPWAAVDNVRLTVIGYTIIGDGLPVEMRAFHRADRSPANLREALQHTCRIGGETWGDRCTCSGEICLRFEDQKVLKSTLLCAFLSASVTACP